MTADEVKHLRTTLRCTARELADTLDLDVATVRAWECGQLFPTKQWVTAMKRLAEQGPTSIQRKPRGKEGPRGLAALAEPQLWELVRKLAAHPQLRARVAELADEYPDPED